jgi:bifunctional non-homologous end joining protein LigD
MMTSEARRSRDLILDAPGSAARSRPTEAAYNGWMPRSSSRTDTRSGRRPETRSDDGSTGRSGSRSLEEYRAKRDFTKSPEPAGDEKPKARASETGRFFCVQRHLATSLHYDFRLEHRGVLLSWAVPKGPSLNPADKRLAMQVEDHPLEYGTFEGVIPEGYGAGVVMLWDQGTWEPEVDDVDAALAKGDLKLRLDGYKLKGSWVLVRTRGWGGSRSSGERTGDKPGGSRSWLLIKHRDEWSGPIDITTFAPRSVKSNGTFRDILMQEAPSVWHGNRGAAGQSGDAALRRIVERVLALEEEEGSAPSIAESAPSATQPARKAAVAKRPRSSQPRTYAKGEAAAKKRRRTSGS